MCCEPLAEPAKGNRRVEIWFQGPMFASRLRPGEKPCGVENKLLPILFTMRGFVRRRVRLLDFVQSSL